MSTQIIVNNQSYTRKNLLPQTQAIITRAINEGFIIPNDRVILAMDSHIRELIGSGIWDNSDVYYQFAYNSTNLLDFSRINWKQPFGSLLGVISTPIYTVSGWEGNGMDGYLDTNYLVASGNTYTYNSAAIGGTIYKAQVGGSTTTGRLCSTLSQEIITITTSSVGIRSRLQTTANLSVSLPYTGLGWKSLSKSVAGSRDAVNKDNMMNIPITEGIPDTNGLRVVLLASPANPVYSNNGVSNYILGGSISMAQSQIIRTSYNKYLTSIGLTAYA